jgi:hypothetical protein
MNTKDCCCKGRPHTKYLLFAWFNFSPGEPEGSWNVGPISCFKNSFIASPLTAQKNVPEFLTAL